MFSDPSGATPFPAVRARRVVTGVDPSGRSVVVSDGEAPTVVGGGSEPGMQVVELWQTLATPPELTGEDRSVLPHRIEPVAGGLHWRIVVFPEHDVPGFVHRTDSVDLLYIVRGRIVLGVGDDADSMREVPLGAGDAVVALGNVHRWRNPGPGPCVTVVSMLSARRPGERAPATPGPPA